MGSYLRVNSIIYKENFEINLTCPWLPVYNVVTTLSFLAIHFHNPKIRISNERGCFSWFTSTNDLFLLKFLEELDE